ncbi:MAG: GntR family transcriptional regulator [Gemmatimonadaceae bacterium]
MPAARPKRTSQRQRAGAIPRGDLIDDAHDRLRGLIVAGRLAPGAPIIETEVAAMLGVRRAHLRVALQRLQHAGLVISSPIGTYSRSRVAPLTLPDVTELLALIGALEGIAARNAAGLTARERRELTAELRRINRDLRASSRGTPMDFHRLDGQFHDLYVTRGAGPRVRMLYDTIKPQADRYVLMYTAHALFDQLPVSAGEHDAIIEAIAGGDADAAQRAAEANWLNATARFARFIEIAGERGNGSA